MRITGASPTVNRIMATCGPERRADATVAANAIAPNIVAEPSMRRRARWVARRSLAGSVIVSDAKRTECSMQPPNVLCREARSSDRAAIVDFQITMAREIEDVALD